jgi:hypothetical protein
MTGKTILAKLLAVYAREHHPDTTTVFLAGQLNTSEWRQDQGYIDFICSQSKGSIIGDDFDSPRKPILIIVDDAQISYTDHGFWIGFVKSQSTMARIPNRRMVLFSACASATAEVLNIRGSASILLSQAKGEIMRPPGLHDGFHSLSLGEKDRGGSGIIQHFGRGGAPSREEHHATVRYACHS